MLNWILASPIGSIPDSYVVRLSGPIPLGLSNFDVLNAKTGTRQAIGPERRTTYESGIEPMGEARIQFNIRYYMFALLFVLFDVETLFLYPWAVTFRQLGLSAFLEALVFITILILGLVYAWRKGALEWS
jgi:NAD(P)H-quinone oxidoreductase subunit 3